jgi:hypothetical protein
MEGNQLKSRPVVWSLDVLPKHFRSNTELLQMGHDVTLCFPEITSFWIRRQATRGYVVFLFNVNCTDCRQLWTIKNGEVVKYVERSGCGLFHPSKEQRWLCEVFSLTLKPYLAHTVCCMCLVYFSQWTATVSLNSINRLVFVAVT